MGFTDKNAYTFMNSGGKCQGRPADFKLTKYTFQKF